MKVIASAGTDAKVEYMRSIGADFAFNYKTEGSTTPLSQYPAFNVFWVCIFHILYYRSETHYSPQDNVGGAAFEAALSYILPFGRVVVSALPTPTHLAKN
jgi:NADPH-dependent curcumin reductase CurA